MEEAGANPALYPKLYMREPVPRGASRSLGKPEKAGSRARRPFGTRDRMSQKTDRHSLPRPGMETPGPWRIAQE